MFASLLKQALEKNHLVLDESIQQKLIQYLESMLEWNRVYNLTNITEPREMVYLHIIDSLSVNPFLNGKHMLDVGTGAGLPGIPLALINPDQTWTLLDKNSKKTRFLTQMIAELNIKNAEAIHSRSEDFHPSPCFDTIISRAFGSLELFTETTGHLLCANGVWIAMKGKYPEEEIRDISNSPFRIEQVVKLEINGMDIERHLIKLKKE